MKRLEAICIAEHWDPQNTAATRYCEDNEARLRTKAAIKKNPEDAEFQKSGTHKDVLFDFGAKYKSGEVESIDSYYKSLDDANAERLFFESVTRRPEFESMKENLDEYL